MLIEQAKRLYLDNELIEAEKAFQLVLDSNKNNAEAWYFLGLIAYAHKDYDGSVQYINNSIELEDNNPEYYNAIANSFFEINNFESAIKAINKAIGISPDYMQLHVKKGFAYHGLGNYLEASYAFNRAIELNNNFSPSHLGLGIVQLHMNNLHMAENSFKKVLELDPNCLDALNNLSSVYTSLKNPMKAKQLLESLLAKEPNHLEALNNLGNVYIELGDLVSATGCYQKILENDPNHLIARLNLANTYNNTRQYEQAILLFESILETLASDEIPNTFQANYISDKTLIGLSTAYNSTCNFDKSKELFGYVKALIDNSINVNGPPIIDPLSGTIYKLDEERQIAIANKNAKYYKALASTFIVKEQLPEVRQKDKLKIGYLSPDFGDHPVGLLISNLFSFHDRNKFEIVALATKNNKGKLNNIIKSSADYYYDLSELSSNQMVSAIRKLEIDILIDLCGYTQNARPEVLAAKAAPVQALWLGYEDTLQIPEVQYFITHEIQVPNRMAPNFTEKFIFLPETKIASDLSLDHFRMPDSLPTRKEYGLPEDKFIFCCFNKASRIDDVVFECWMRILRKVPNSILWLNSDSALMEANIINTAHQYGITDNRIIFKKTSYLNYDWYHSLADLYLDTFTESGTTTGVLAALAKLPVLTHLGETTPSCGGASVNVGSNSFELIAKSEKEYIDKAILFATCQDSYKTMINKLKEGFGISPIFNASRFIKHLELGFELMWKDNIIKGDEQIIRVPKIS